MASVTGRRSDATGIVTWRVQFRVNGKMSQESFPDKRGADQFGELVDRIGGAAAREVLETRRNRDVGVPTLREFTARYLDEDSGLLTGIEPGTRNGYQRIAERSFLPVLGDYPIDAVQKGDIGRWVAWQEKQPSSMKGRSGQLLSAKTIRNYHALLSSIFASAVEEGLRPDNPAYRTRLSRGQKHEGVFLTPEEFATILAFIPPRWEAFILLLASTGLRWGEATALTWADLNLTAHPPTVRVDKAWKKSTTGAPVLKHPKSRAARRTVSMTMDVVHALGEPGPRSDLIFAGELSGKHLWYGRFRTTTWVPAVLKAQDPELCEKYGLTPITKSPTLHDLRHSHASWLIADGRPLAHIQARLGHESITTTVGVYGHLQPDAHIDMADSIGRTLSGVRTLRQLEPAVKG
ncbi:tyrosine-type recombinase/integrase [Microbacterium lacus]|uniref:tyrosine-type recombinase/integrase n=1 Tax=Microbacterium lacus TaxID=415217 RepID=UPI000C2BD967|nr:site-specific integrase [Microbacterium lacus]